MISLRRIVEYAMLQGQGYDLGKDFANFQRAVQGSEEQVKQKFENSMNSKLAGKRVRARASRGYKQFEKDYEFDVSRVTIDDYYDNFVVVAHDEANKKRREYFLKPGARIQILGAASGQVNPQTKASEPQPPIPKVVATPEESIPTDNPTTHPMKEETGTYDAYSIDSIVSDISPWAKILMKDPRLEIRKFVKSLGWMRTLSNGKTVAIYDLHIPIEDLKIKLSPEGIKAVMRKMSKPTGNVDVQFDVVRFDRTKDIYKVRIKKTMRETGSTEQPVKTFQVDEPEEV